MNSKERVLLAVNHKEPDILNPILPLDNMDPVRLKREFGSQLCFEGGVDIEHVLPFGTIDEVREHAKRVIEILAPGGGFIFKAQAISRLIPYENLSTTYNLALEYGRYDGHHSTESAMNGGEGLP